MSKIKTNSAISIGTDSCGPIERCNLLKKSMDSYREGDDWKSIFYESKAMCFSFFRDYKHQSTYNGPSGMPFNDQEPPKLSNILRFISNNRKACGVPTKPMDDGADELSKTIDSSPLLEYVMVSQPIDNLMDGMVNMNLNQKEPSTIQVDEATAIKDLMNCCAALPTEWTVVQICKMNDVYNGFARESGYFTTLKPIKFTLLCYSRSEWMDGKPLCCHLDFEDVALLKSVYGLYFDLFRNAFDTQFVTSESIVEVSTEMTKMIDMLKIWLGPWVVLLSGKVRGSKGAELETKVEKKVLKFCAANGLVDARQKVFLLLVARRIDLVDTDGISKAATFIGSNPIQCSAVKQFLSLHKLGFDNTGIKYYPCILVLDEMLDTIPWEMMIPAQETSRFNSVYTLFDLHREYRDQISDGYLRVAVKTGNALINPSSDSNLSTMVKRMGDFLRYWVPHWHLIEQTTPSEAEMKQLLSTADVYSYSGHSSSIQYVFYDQLKRLKTKSIFLLFGCEAVAVSLNGGHSEACQPHMYLHAAKCPTIVGPTTVVTDLWIDVISIYLLSLWIPSNKTAIWTPSHIGNNESMIQRVHKILDTLKGSHEPSLLAILAKIRLEPLINIRTKAVMVCRGLPTLNTMANTDKLLK